MRCSSDQLNIIGHRSGIARGRERPRGVSGAPIDLPAVGNPRHRNAQDLILDAPAADSVSPQGGAPGAAAGALSYAPRVCGSSPFAGGHESSRCSLTAAARAVRGAFCGIVWSNVISWMQASAVNGRNRWIDGTAIVATKGGGTLGWLIAPALPCTRIKQGRDGSYWMKLAALLCCLCQRSVQAWVGMLSLARRKSIGSAKGSRACCRAHVCASSAPMSWRPARLAAAGWPIRDGLPPFLKIQQCCIASGRNRIPCDGTLGGEAQQIVRPTRFGCKETGIPECLMLDCASTPHCAGIGTCVLSGVWLNAAGCAMRCWSMACPRMKVH